jgi:hypothetical protein
MLENNSAGSVLVLVRPFFMSRVGMLMRTLTAGRMLMNMALLVGTVVMGKIMLMIVLMLMRVGMRMGVCVAVVCVGVLMIMPVSVVMIVTMFVFSLHEVLLLQYAYFI